MEHRRVADGVFNYKCDELIHRVHRIRQIEIPIERRTLTDQAFGAVLNPSEWRLAPIDSQLRSYDRAGDANRFRTRRCRLLHLLPLEGSCILFPNRFAEGTDFCFGVNIMNDIAHDLCLGLAVGRAP